MPSMAKLELACEYVITTWLVPVVEKQTKRSWQREVSCTFILKIQDNRVSHVLTFWGILYYFLGIYYGMISVPSLEIKLIFFRSSLHQYFLVLYLVVCHIIYMGLLAHKLYKKNPT